MLRWGGEAGGCGWEPLPWWGSRRSEKQGTRKGTVDPHSASSGQEPWFLSLSLSLSPSLSLSLSLSVCLSVLLCFSSGKGSYGLVLEILVRGTPNKQTNPLGCLGNLHKKPFWHVAFSLSAYICLFLSLAFSLSAYICLCVCLSISLSLCVCVKTHNYINQCVWKPLQWYHNWVWSLLTDWLTHS